MIKTIDSEVAPKSAIAYTLAQAILALGKDDLRRVYDNIKYAQELLDEYEKRRNPDDERYKSSVPVLR